MTTIEEQIWDYLDGNGDEAWRSAMERKIAEEEAYKTLYNELSALQDQLGSISLDEPSMSFTRNVMELVNLEAAPVSLKTRIDKRIILGVASFFVLAIAAIFIYALSQSQVEQGTFKLPKLNFNINTDRYITPMLIKTFLFIDVILGFLYVDWMIRRKRMQQTK